MIQRALKSLPLWLTVGGILLLVLSAWLWWTFVYKNPYNVFWGMIDNNLKTASATKQISEVGGSSRLDQTVAMNYGANNNVYVLTTIKNGDSTVKTTSIGTLKDNYQEYTSIKTSQKNKNGQAFKFDEVLNKWAKQPIDNASASDSQGSLFSQTVLGPEGGNVLPMGNFSETTRSQLVKNLQDNDVFTVSYSGAQAKTENGRPVYIYNLNVEPVAYIGFEKMYAKAMGLKALDNIDPNQYQGSQAIKLAVTVDIRSHQLKKIAYTGTTHSETFSSYGVAHQVVLPRATITSSQLQSLLQKAQ